MRVISFDPRGYGSSQPPSRDFPRDFLERDADDAAGLMQELGVTRFSVAGWSDGANTAALLTAKYPKMVPMLGFFSPFKGPLHVTEQVQKLMMWGGNATVGEEDIELYEKTRDVSKWSTKMNAMQRAIYGSNLQVFSFCRFISNIKLFIVADVDTMV